MKSHIRYGTPLTTPKVGDIIQLRYGNSDRPRRVTRVTGDWLDTESVKPGGRNTRLYRRTWKNYNLLGRADGSESAGTKRTFYCLMGNSGRFMRFYEDSAQEVADAALKLKDFEDSTELHIFDAADAKRFRVSVVPRVTAL